MLLMNNRSPISFCHQGRETVVQRPEGQLLQCLMGFSFLLCIERFLKLRK